MRTMRGGWKGLALVFAAALPAWGADSATVYNSGPLVLAFLGLCALVVLAQFAPVVMFLVGLVKGVAEILGRRRVLAREHRRV